MEMGGLATVITATLGGLTGLALVLVLLVFVKEAVGPVGQGIGSAISMEAEGNAKYRISQGQAIVEAVKLKAESLDFKAENGHGAMVSISLKGPGTVAQVGGQLGGMLGAGARVAGLLPPPPPKSVNTP